MLWYGLPLELSENALSFGCMHETRPTREHEVLMGLDLWKQTPFVQPRGEW